MSAGGSKGVKWASPYVYKEKDREKSMWAPTVVLAPSKRPPMTAPSHLTTPMTAPSHLTMAQFTMAPTVAPIMARITAPISMAQFTMTPIMAPISMAPTAAPKRQHTFINMADQVEQKRRKLPDQIGNTKAKHTGLNSVQTSHGTVLVVDDASAHTQRNIPAQQPVHQPAPTEKSAAENAEWSTSRTSSFAGWLAEWSSIPKVGRTPTFAEYPRMPTVHQPAPTERSAAEWSSIPKVGRTPTFAEYPRMPTVHQPAPTERSAAEWSTQEVGKTSTFAECPKTPPMHQPAPTERSAAKWSTPEVGRTPTFAECSRTSPPCPPTPDEDECTMQAVRTLGRPRSSSKSDQAAQTLLTLHS